MFGLQADDTGVVDTAAMLDGSGTGYAEMFEWADGNPVGADRRGLFVTLEGERIRIAQRDDVILGVIAAAPAFTGGVIDPDSPAVPRSIRADWAAVGLLGKLEALDDGSCVLGGLCGPGQWGLGTDSVQGYRVLRRVDENKVLICMK